MKKEFALLAVGELNPDLIVTGLGQPPVPGREVFVRGARLTLGSSTAICAAGVAKLGLPVALVAHVGEDVAGRFCLDYLTRCGVDVSRVKLHPDQPTGFTVSLAYAGDRALLTFPGVMGDLTAGDLPDDLLLRARHLHLSSYFLHRNLREDYAALFARAKALGLTTSLDPGWDPEERFAPPLDPLLPHLDLFLPSEAEALALTRSTTLDEALDRLSQAGPLSVVKCGGRGAVAVGRGYRAQIPAFEVEVVDPTGAGDSFDAGFLYGWLTGRGLEESLRLGAACGALAVQAVGGAEGFAGLRQVEQFLTEARPRPI
ncbi:MAG: carbohydrate kinase family protein [Firmicutes bacterium]|nr:carbohydrate kinase family protein [Bacillota bacterium]